MCALIRIELRKALSNRWFAVALAVGCVLALVSGTLNVVFMTNQAVRYEPRYEESYYFISATSCYRNWLGIDYLQAAMGLFFLLAPLLATVAYSWSLRSELKSGYAASMMVRTSRTRYYGAKCLAAFVAGGLTVAVPLVVNFVLVACFLPAYRPDPYDLIYIGIVPGHLMYPVLYRWPLLYVVLRTLLDFGLAGLWAAAVLGLSVVVRNRVALVAGSFLFQLMLKYIVERLYPLLGVDGVSITLFDWLRAAPDGRFYTWETLLVGACVMAALALLVPWAARRRDVL